MCARLSILGAFLIAVCAVLVSFSFTFENAADLNVLFGVSIFFNIWQALHNPITEALTLPCSEMHRIFTSQQPIIFKQCIPDIVTRDNLVFFSNTKQNIFPDCGDKKVIRNFEFVGFDNTSKAIIEDVPCASTTLKQKINTFDSHNIMSGGDYFEVNTRMLNSSEREHLDRALHRLEVLPLHVSTNSMVAPTLTYFLHAGRAAVYYLHAHMDHFLSFCVQEQKTWLLIEPRHLNSFDSSWTGNAQMMLKEKADVPRITITQKRGDILYVPPWWIHQTLVQRRKKNFGFNLHFGVRGQVLIEMAGFLMEYFEHPSWFYQNIRKEFDQ